MLIVLNAVGLQVSLGVTWGTLGTYWSCPVSIDT